MEGEADVACCCQADTCDTLPTLNTTDVNHTWVVFGGREGRDNVKFPQVIDGVGFDGPGARVSVSV